MPFKMKGWSGNQSPVKQNPRTNLADVQKNLKDIQKNISNTLSGIGTKVRKHVKPQSKSSGFGLTNAEKAQAKKLGISEYQWKTGTGINASTRHKKRMFEKKHGLGKHAEKTTSKVLKYPDEKDEITDFLTNELTYAGAEDHGYKFGTWGVPELWEKTGSYRAPGTKPIWDPSRGGPEQPVTEDVQYHHLGKVYSSLSEAEAAQEKAGGMDVITPTIDGEKATQNEVVEYMDRLNAPTEVDYGTGATTKDWKQESSTGWSLHELTQERKNFEVGSAEYKKIQDAINAAYKDKKYYSFMRPSKDAVEGKYYQSSYQRGIGVIKYQFKDGKYTPINEEEQRKHDAAKKIK